MMRPVMVFGWANKSNFLTAPEKAWHKHWRGVKLVGKYFVWLDKNADGKYQIDEVELFDKPFSKDSYWRQFSIGDDLTLSQRLVCGGIVALDHAVFQNLM